MSSLFFGDIVPIARPSRRVNNRNLFIKQKRREPTLQNNCAIFRLPTRGIPRSQAVVTLVYEPIFIPPHRFELVDADQSGFTAIQILKDGAYYITTNVHVYNTGRNALRLSHRFNFLLEREGVTTSVYDTEAFYMRSVAYGDSVTFAFAANLQVQDKLSLQVNALSFENGTGTEIQPDYSQVVIEY